MVDSRRAGVPPQVQPLDVFVNPQDVDALMGCLIGDHGSSATGPVVTVRGGASLKS